MVGCGLGAGFVLLALVAFLLVTVFQSPEGGSGSTAAKERSPWGAEGVEGGEGLALSA